jgi:hypothetical protein
MNPPNNGLDRQRFLDALPFWVNGTLTNSALWGGEPHLTEHPQLQSQLDFAQATAEQTRALAEHSLQGVPADIGYGLLRSRLKPAASATSAWARLREWLAVPSAQGWRLAQGVAMGLMLGIGVMTLLPTLRDSSHDPASSWRSTAPALAEGPLLRASFKRELTENELRLALIEARVLIVAGPTRLGDYYLKPAPGQLAAARATLLRLGVVQQVDEVPGLPPELLE